MRYFWVKLKKHIKRLSAIVAVFGTAFLVILYFLGYYDFSFLDRYNIMNELNVIGELMNDPPAGGMQSMFTPPDINSIDPGSEDDAQESEILASEDNSDDGGGGNGSTGDEGSHGSANADALYNIKSVTGIFIEDRLPDKLLLTGERGSYTVAQLSEMGYDILGTSYSAGGLAYAAAAAESESKESADDAAEGAAAEGDKDKEEEKTVQKTVDVSSARYAPGKTVLGRMTFPFKLPKVLSGSERTVSRAKINYPADDTEYFITYSDVSEARPAIELYMGYILVDTGDDITVLASDGTPLCAYGKSIYAPAYVRDTFDRPLFTKTDENGKVKYMYLAEDGRNFVPSDYDSTADGRGLRFDYPSYYGKSDSTAVYVNKSGQTGLFAYLVKDVGMLTTYSYTSAYPFTSNRGAVTTTRNRGGMFFVDENGKQAFPTWYSYINEYDRYVFNNLMPPATDGIENIGFYYFENGLTRARRQVIDNWNWSMYRRVRVVVDESILIRPDGSEYELPVGYELEAYSDGMIMLSKNGRYGFTDYTGEWIAQPIYSSATPFVGGLATLTTSDGRCGMIDTEGNIVLQFTYDSISQVSDGIIAAYREKTGWMLFRMMMEE